jgi:hypothetical protein
MLALAALFAGPGALLTAALGLRLNRVMVDVIPDLGEGIWADIPTLTSVQLDRLGGALAGYLLATALAGLLGSIGAVAMSSLALAGEGSGFGLADALRMSLRRTPSVLVCMALTGVIVAGLVVAALLAMSLTISSLSPGPVSRGGPGVFLALVIGVALVVVLAWLTVRWSLAYPALAAEPVGWRAALARSWWLSRDHVWRIFGVILAGALVTIVLGALISQLAAVLLVDVVGNSAGLDPDVTESVALALGTVILAPLSPLLLAASYAQLRPGSGGSL